jgi:hypothetical protein
MALPKMLKITVKFPQPNLLNIHITVPCCNHHTHRLSHLSSHHHNLYLPNLHYNIIIPPFLSQSSKWAFPQDISAPKHDMHARLLPHSSYMPSVSWPRHHYPNTSWWPV